MPSIDVVSDASVALKWFHESGEEDVTNAQQLIELHRKRTIRVVVLDLTHYEIANALLRGRAHLDADRVFDVLAALDTICPTVSLSVAERGLAARVAELHDLTHYDAAYAVAAQSVDGRLATYDNALLAAGLGQRPGVIVKTASR